MNDLPRRGAVLALVFGGVSLLAGTSIVACSSSSNAGPDGSSAVIEALY